MLALRHVLPSRLGSAIGCITLLTLGLLAGCAQQPPRSSTPGADTASQLWTGRISVQVQSEPPQSLSGSFELKGRPEQGELSLISPLGNVLGILRWSPDEAMLDSGDGKPQRFRSVEELMLTATGASIPLDALFAWLKGDNAAVQGWTADLSRRAEGRVSARRTQPQPQADLRVVLDR